MLKNLKSERKKSDKKGVRNGCFYPLERVGASKSQRESCRVGVAEWARGLGWKRCGLKEVAAQGGAGWRCGLEVRVGAAALFSILNFRTRFHPNQTKNSKFHILSNFSKGCWEGWLSHSSYFTFWIYASLSILDLLNLILIIPKLTKYFSQFLAGVAWWAGGW